MCKIKRRFLMILTIGVAIAISSTALAHKVNIIKNLLLILHIAFPF